MTQQVLPVPDKKLWYLVRGKCCARVWDELRAICCAPMVNPFSSPAMGGGARTKYRKGMGIPMSVAPGPQPQPSSYPAPRSVGKVVGCDVPQCKKERGQRAHGLQSRR